LRAGPGVALLRRARFIMFFVGGVQPRSVPLELNVPGNDHPCFLKAPITRSFIVFAVDAINGLAVGAFN
jgi:hypothetical protein